MSRDTRVGQTLRFGQPGTLKLVERFGDALVCVRYRYSAAEERRLTTVELIVDTGDWQPDLARASEQLALVRIAYGETDLRLQVKEAGGVWRRAQGLWELPAAGVRTLKLEARVVRWVDKPLCP